MTHSRLTAKNRDQLRNPTLGSRVWATLFLPHDVVCNDSELGYNCAERKQVATHSVATARIAAA